MLSQSHPHGNSRSVRGGTPKVEDNDLIVPTVIKWVTFETGVVSYMVVHHALLMSLKVIYFQSIFLIDFVIKRPIYMQESGINFTNLLFSRKCKRKQELQ